MILLQNLKTTKKPFDITGEKCYSIVRVALLYRKTSYLGF